MEIEIYKGFKKYTLLEPIELPINYYIEGGLIFIEDEDGSEYALLMDIKKQIDLIKGFKDNLIYK